MSDSINYVAITPNNWINISTHVVIECFFMMLKYSKKEVIDTKFIILGMSALIFKRKKSFNLPFVLLL